jgi:GNAT superfamily N-acetyltransferase
VLWPSIDPDHQLLPYDHLTTTLHFGAFLITSCIPPASLSSTVDNAYLVTSEGQLPVGVLTVTLEPFARPESLPPSCVAANVSRQLHKFAVHPDLQGYAIGRQLLEHVISHLTLTAGEHMDAVLFHFDARANQRGFYEKLGMQLLDPEVFVKRGPTGNGPPVEHVRMGKLLVPVDATRSI